MPARRPVANGAGRRQTRRFAARLGGLVLEHPVESPGEQVRVARPAGRHVVAVLDDERRAVVVARPALGRARPALELPRVAQGAHDLVLDVLGVGAVVAAQPPRRQQERAALHVLGQARRAPVEQDALPGGGIDRAREDDDAVADRADGALEAPELGHLGAQHVAAQVLAHPRRMATGQHQAVDTAAGRSPPRRSARGTPGRRRAARRSRSAPARRPGGPRSPRSAAWGRRRESCRRSRWRTSPRDRSRSADAMAPPPRSCRSRDPGGV